MAFALNQHEYQIRNADGSWPSVWRQDNMRLLDNGKHQIYNLPVIPVRGLRVRLKAIGTNSPSLPLYNLVAFTGGQAVVLDSITKLYITTDNFPNISKTTAQPATYRLENGTLGAQYTSAQLAGGTASVGTIKGAGNFTWMQAYKPYNATFASKLNLLGFATSSKKYRLLKEYLDPSLLKNATMARMGVALGMVGVNMAPLEVYLSEDSGTTFRYLGYYTIANKADEAAFDTVALTPTIVFEKVIDTQDPPVDPVTGIANPLQFKSLFWNDDYGTEYDNYAPIYGGVAHSVIIIPSKSLVDTEIETAKQKFIASENAAKKPYADLVEGVQAFHDIPSMLGYLTVQELFKNADGESHSSYSYLGADGKIYWGPLWDFDQSMNRSPTSFWTLYTPFFTHLRRDDDFMRAWGNYLDANMAKIVAMIDQITTQAALLVSSGAVEREYQATGRYAPEYAGLLAYGAPITDYNAEVSKVTDFLRTSLQFLRLNLSRTYYGHMRPLAFGDNAFVQFQNLSNVRAIKFFFKTRLPISAAKTSCLIDFHGSDYDALYNASFNAGYAESGIAPNLTVYTDADNFTTALPHSGARGRGDIESIAGDGNWHCYVFITDVPLNNIYPNLLMLGGRYDTYGLPGILGTVEILNAVPTREQMRSQQALPASMTIMYANGNVRSSDNYLIDESGNGNHGAIFPRSIAPKAV